MVAAGAGSARLTPASLRLSLAYARFRQRLCLPWLRSFARFRSEVLRLRLRKKKRYFREKRAFRGTHIFPENGMLGFCSASAPQKQDLQKSTLHNTQLWDIFNPSAFGYGEVLFCKTASDRPPFRAFDLRLGSAKKRMTAFLPPPLAGSLWSALPPSLHGFGSMSPLSLRPCQKRKLQKALPFTIFFPTNYLYSNKLYYFCVTNRKESKK